jgi:hypothetical protein
LVAYSGQGVYKSVTATTRNGTNRAIQLAVQEEGKHLLMNMEDERIIEEMVLKNFSSYMG